MHQVSSEVIDAEIISRLKEKAEVRCMGWGGRLMEFNGEVDHVHLLIALPPNLDLSVFVNNLKTTSSRLIRKEFAAKMNRVYRKPVFWSRSYCIISCGGAPLSILKQYIEQQRSPNDEEESSCRAEIPRRTAFSHPRPH
jgi:putative transposase